VQCATGCMHAHHDTVYSCPVLMLQLLNASILLSLQLLDASTLLMQSLFALLMTPSIYCYNHTLYAKYCTAGESL
jgi:hypothetical protein